MLYLLAKKFSPLIFIMNYEEGKPFFILTFVAICWQVAFRISISKFLAELAPSFISFSSCRSLCGALCLALVVTACESGYDSLSIANPLSGELDPPETFSVLSVFDLQFLMGSSLQRIDFSGADNASSGHVTVVRDSQGRALRTNFYDGDGRLYHYESYSYNLTTGRLMELHEYDGGGERREYSRYGYNLTTGRLVRADYYDDDGALLGYTLYGYDSVGHSEREDDYYGNEAAAAVKYRIYEYNAEGRLIRKDFYSLSNRVATQGAQDTSTQVASTQDTSTQVASTQDASTQVASTHDNSTHDNSTQDASTQVASTHDNSTHDNSTQGTQDTSTQDNSTYTQDSYETYIYDSRGRLIRRNAYDGSGSLKGFAALIYATDAWSVGAVTVSAADVKTGESVNLTLPYSCSGFCPAVNISWYLSTNATIDFSDTLIGGESIAQSAAGSFMAESYSDSSGAARRLLLLCVYR